jgi:hypothetical protein
MRASTTMRDFVLITAVYHLIDNEPGGAGGGGLHCCLIQHYSRNVCGLFEGPLKN